MSRMDTIEKYEKNLELQEKKLPTYISEWIEVLKASNMSHTTIKSYLFSVTKYMESINENEMDEIKFESLNVNSVAKYFNNIKYKESSNGKALTSDSYKVTNWYAIRSFFEYLVASGYVDKNPTDVIKKPKNKDLDKINNHRILLTEDDFYSILQSVLNGAGNHKAKARQELTKNRDYAIMLLFMSTGMRRAAMSEIDVNDVDMEHGRLRVIDKEDKEHVYELNDLCISALNNWLEDRKIIMKDYRFERAMFVSLKRERLSPQSIYDLVKKYTKDALGYSVSPHKLRAGFCSIMYNQTGNIEFVRRAVGHSNVNTTQRYIVTSNDEKRKSANIINKVLSKRSC